MREVSESGDDSIFASGTLVLRFKEWKDINAMAA